MTNITTYSIVFTLTLFPFFHPFPHSIVFTCSTMLFNITVMISFNLIFFGCKQRDKLKDNPMHKETCFNFKWFIYLLWFILLINVLFIYLGQGYYNALIFHIFCFKGWHDKKKRSVTKLWKKNCKFPGPNQVPY